MPFWLYKLNTSTNKTLYLLHTIYIQTRYISRNKYLVNVMVK